MLSEAALKKHPYSLILRITRSPVSQRTYPCRPQLLSHALYLYAWLSTLLEGHLFTCPPSLRANVLQPSQQYSAVSTNLEAPKARDFYMLLPRSWHSTQNVNNVSRLLWLSQICLEATSPESWQSVISIMTLRMALGNIRMNPFLKIVTKLF